MSKKQDKIKETILRSAENSVASVADDNVKVNMEFETGAGMEPKIIRSSDGKCCGWCSSLVGEYYEDDAPDDIYARHDNCNCTVTYISEKGYQDAHSKKWIDQQELDARRARIKENKSYMEELEAERTAGRLRRKSTDITLIAKNQEENVRGTAARTSRDKMLKLAKDGDIFVNRSDKLHDYAKKIKPIPGYRDFVCHADQYSFAFTDKNGNESNVSAKEFCDILDASGKYHGEKIRLLACQAGAGEAAIPRYIAKRYDTEVMAPTEVVNVDFNGNFILADNEEYAKIGIETGRWRRFDKDGEIK